MSEPRDTDFGFLHAYRQKTIGERRLKTHVEDCSISPYEKNY
jgi:hypothetical protein